jgi:predicted nucleic acid-binding protein
LIWSYAIIYEVSKIIDGQKNQYLSNLRDRAEICIMVDGAIKNRAELFMGCGIKALDALHLSCAERAGVDFFITTDDKLKNIMSRYRDISTVKVVNPAQWYQEVVDDESENAA